MQANADSAACEAPLSPPWRHWSGVCSIGRDDALFNRTKNRVSAGIEHFDPHAVAEVQKPGARLAVTDDFEHSLLGQTRGAARFVLVGHRTRANDSSSTKRPGLGGVGNELGKIELHVVAGLGRAEPRTVDVAVQRQVHRAIAPGIAKLIGSHQYRT